MEKHLGRYIRWQRSVGHSPRTWFTHNQNINFFIKWLKEQGHSTDIEDLDINLAREWIEHMQDKGLSDYTILTRVRSLRAFTNWLKLDEWIEKDPLARLRPPKVEDKAKEVLTPEQVDKLLATCDKQTVVGLRDTAIVLTLYSTGIRVSELVALRLDDIDQERGLIMIRRGKGGKFRVVPLGAKVDRAIDRYLSKRPSNHPVLFLTDEGEPISYFTIVQLMRRKSEKTGNHFNPHLFRHTFAVQYLRNGGKLETLKAIMGHTSYEMTLHYARIAGVDVASAHALVDPARSLKSK